MGLQWQAIRGRKPVWLGPGGEALTGANQTPLVSCRDQESRETKNRKYYAGMQGKKLTKPKTCHKKCHEKREK